MKSAHLITLLAGAFMAGTASAEWSRLPALEAAPVNLASNAILGTGLHSSAGITNAAALLSGSVSEVAGLGAGRSEAVISLSGQLLIEGVSFLNEGVAGKVSVATSADLREWQALAQREIGHGDRLVSVKFAGVQAKYVRLEFEAATSASIRSLKLTGPEASRDFQTVTLESGRAIQVNLVSDTLGARPVYVFPSPVAQGAEAGAVEQGFQFAQSRERYRTVVYDLGAPRTVQKFSAAYSRIPTRLEVFALEQLPEKKDWRGKLTLDSVVFDKLKPVASAEDASGAGSLYVAAAQPVGARYIVLRFEPNYTRRSVTGLAPYWKGMAVAAVDLDASFVAYDVSAEGQVPLLLIAKNAITRAQQQLGAGSSEIEAVHALLSSAGFTPLPQNVVVSKDKPNTLSSNPGSATGTAPGVNELGLSAYRAGAGEVDEREAILNFSDDSSSGVIGAAAVNPASAPAPATIAPTSN